MPATDLRNPEVGSPIRRGETVTMVDVQGNPVEEYHVEMPRPNTGYLVPPGLAKQAEQQRQAEETPKPTATDFIAQDAAPPEYPEGSPELVPLYKLSFSKRADAMDSFAKLEKMDVGLKEGEELTMSKVAEQYRALAEIDKFLASVAVNAEDYYRWIAGPGLDETTFGQLWAAYQARMQPGEAQRSSS
jgi:hypothetical protein